MKDAGKNFVELTKYPNISESDQEKKLPQPPLEDAAIEGKEHIKLPDPKDLDPKVSFKTLVDQRRSVRAYDKTAMTLLELSFLLWCTQGVKESTTRPVTLRTVPSAGARHPFETYLLVNNIDGLEPGLYRYLAIEHTLQFIRTGCKTELTEACLGQEMVPRSAVTFFWAATVYRMTWRYVERGFRYLYLDAGHVCQNLYLAAETIDYGVCAIAAYDDDAVDKAIGLDGQERFTVYCATVGKKLPPKAKG